MKLYLATDYSRVLQALPPALKLAAMTLATLPEALSQLWELAQDDDRPINPNPQHPLRILRELAEFGLAKPILFNNRMIDIVSTWFVDGQRLSPFEVLEPMLATAGSAIAAIDVLRAAGVPEKHIIMINFLSSPEGLRRVGIVALARRLLIALWRFVTDGVIPAGATLKPVAA